MTDLEIKQYLQKNNGALTPEDYLHKIFNTSPQIRNEYYDFENCIMTITTPDNTFSFDWILKTIY